MHVLMPTVREIEKKEKRKRANQKQVLTRWDKNCRSCSHAIIENFMCNIRNLNQYNIIKTRSKKAKMN